MDDIELLRLLKAGNRKAFDSIFLKYYPLLSGFCASIGGYCEDCEDLVADIFLDLWIKRETLTIHTSLKFYLYTAVKYKIYTLKGKSRKVQFLPEEFAADQPGDDHHRPDEKLIRKDRNLMIERFMNELPEQGKLIFSLKWQHQLDYNEIAEILQLSPSTVKTHVYRAIKYIRTQLSFVK